MANGKGNRGGGDNRTPKLTYRKTWALTKGILTLTLLFTTSKPVNGKLTGTVFGQEIDSVLNDGKARVEIQNINPMDGKSQLEVTAETDQDGVLTLSEEIIISQPTNSYNIDLGITEYEVEKVGQPNELRFLLSVQVSRANGLPYSNLVGLQITCLNETKTIIINASGVGEADFGPGEYGKEYEVTLSTPDYGSLKRVIALSVPAIAFTVADALEDRDVNNHPIVPTTFRTTVSTFDEEKHTNPVIRVSIQVGTTFFSTLTEPDGRATFTGLPLTAGEKETKYTVWVPGDVHKNCTISHTHFAANPAVVTPKDKSFFQVLQETLKKQVGK